jgi:LemA protein
MHYWPLFAVAGVGALLWWTVNRLAALDSRCERAFADIDVQLKHRHALLPNLVAAVKAFQSHELAVLDQLSRAREAALSAGAGAARARAEEALSVSLSQLLGAAQTMPPLQSSEHFQSLCADIAGAELKIAAARRFFNACVAEYNAALRQFPANLIGSKFGGHGRRAFYDIGIERALLDDPAALKF